MGFLAVSVLSYLNFFAKFDKTPSSPAFLLKWLQNVYLIRIIDITEKLLQNAVEWRLFELHSMLQCRDIEQDIHLPMCAIDRGGRLIEYLPAPTFP